MSNVTPAEIAEIAAISRVDAVASGGTYEGPAIATYARSVEDARALALARAAARDAAGYVHWRVRGHDMDAR